MRADTNALASSWAASVLSWRGSVVTTWVAAWASIVDSWPGRAVTVPIAVGYPFYAVEAT